MVYRENAGEAAPALQPYLQLGERLEWSAPARTGIVFRRSDIFLIPFSLAWGGFAMIWELGVLASPAPFPVPLFGVPFVLVGLYLIVGRFFHDAYRRKRTLYGLTNRRVLLLTGRTLTSVALRQLGQLSITEGRDGRGTITLGDEPGPWQPSTWPGQKKRAPTLDLATDAHAVFVAITGARDLASAGAG